MHLKRRMGSMLLSLAMALTLAAPAFADSEVVASGNCGETGSNLTWVLTEDGVMTISGKGDMANYGDGAAPWQNYNSRIQSVVVEEGALSIGQRAFDECGMTSVKLPSTLDEICFEAFIDCKQLKNVEIAEGLNVIGYYAFSNCTALTEFTIPNGVRYINEGAFSGCSSLARLNLAANVWKIRLNAFSKCTGLTDVFYGGNQMNWKAMEIDNGNDKLINAERHYSDFCEACGVCGPYDSNADYYADNLTWVIAADGTLTISGKGLMADWDQSGAGRPWKNYAGMITAVVLPRDLLNIGAYAFRECKKLTSLTIPEGVLSLGVNSLGECTALKSVHIPKSLMLIDDSAFIATSSLTDIYYAGTSDDWKDIKIVTGYPLYGNDKLLEPEENGITIHYNSPAPTDPAELEGGFNEDDAELVATVANAVGAKLIAASYDGAGRLVEVKVLTVEADGKIETGLTWEMGCSYKLMLVDGTTFAPLCAAWECVPDIK